MQPLFHGEKKNYVFHSTFQYEKSKYIISEESHRAGICPTPTVHNVLTVYDTLLSSSPLSLPHGGGGTHTLFSVLCPMLTTDLKQTRYIILSLFYRVKMYFKIVWLQIKTVNEKKVLFLSVYVYVRVCVCVTITVYLLCQTSKVLCN